MRVWSALAASALLATSVGLFVSRNRVTALERDAVGDHRNCAVTFRLAERPVSLSDAAARYDPIYARLEDTPPNELPTALGPLRVAQRHACVFAGRRFGHVVLRYGGHLVSVLVTETRVSSDDRASVSAVPLWLPRVDGQSVASFTTAGHNAFIVSDLPDEQFRAMAQALTASMARRLATTRWSLSTGLGDQCRHAAGDSSVDGSRVMP
jgi:hypothetical protein